MLIPTIIKRILTAITTGLNLQDWAIILAILGLYTAICIPIGFKIGFLYRTRLPKGWQNKIISMIKVLIIPVLPEELLFRVILLPHPFTEKVSTIQWIITAIITLILFILYHPILAKLFFAPGDPLFYNPIFLGFAGLLGLACTVAYWFTGSFWGIVLIHWIIDWIWLYSLGGKSKLSGYNLL